MAGVSLVGNFRFMCYLPMSSLAAIKTKETVETRLAFLAIFFAFSKCEHSQCVEKIKVAEHHKGYNLIFLLAKI